MAVRDVVGVRPRPENAIAVSSRVLLVRPLTIALRRAADSTREHSFARTLNRGYQQYLRTPCDGGQSQGRVTVEVGSKSRHSRPNRRWAGVR